jgi:hypothetical protein
MLLNIRVWWWKAEGKRPLLRPWRRWEDIFKVHLKGMYKMV